MCTHTYIYIYIYITEDIQAALLAIINLRETCDAIVSDEIALKFLVSCGEDARWAIALSPWCFEKLTHVFGNTSLFFCAGQ